MCVMHKVMVPQTRLRIFSDGIAILELCNPPVNALHPKVLQDLGTCLEQANSDPAVKAIVITGAGSSFCAGFDINQFVSGGRGLDSDVNNLLNTIVEDGPKPTVAAIRGTALGGGLEVAMACNARVCSPRATLGLPELQLGIIPGMGGTQRLPRLVGLAKGVEMILGSKPVSGTKAKALGLVDAVCTDETVLVVARQLALALALGERPRRRALRSSDRLEPTAEGREVLRQARERTAKGSPHLRHPLLCLDAIETGFLRGGQAGLKAEKEAFEKSAALDTHKALVHIFFARRNIKKVRGITDQGLRARPVKCVAVVGGGLMGSGIATAAALSGVRVILKEVDEKFLTAGMGRIQANLKGAVKKGQMKEEQAHKVMGLVKGALDYSSFREADMVIEAALEDVGLKQRIFSELESACREDCILASNTSTIDISLIGRNTRAAGRILGAHFFSPAHIMPLLEIVRTDETSPQVVLDTLEFAAAIRKSPVVVGNCTGFAVNRCFFPYNMAAMMLVDLGLDPYKIDRDIKEGFGMPMGPFALSDLVGADIGFHVGSNFVESFPERVYQSTMLVEMNRQRRLGQKTGAGFYRYGGDGRRGAPDPEGICPFVDHSRRAAKLPAAAAGMSTQDVIEFVFFPVVNEGCRIVAEGIVDKPADLDVAIVLGMGFPAFRGGPIKWADLVGAQRIVSRLEGWAQQFPAHAGFFRPCEYLTRCAAAGSPLEQGAAPAAPRL